jgi:hypothetical protein
MIIQKAHTQYINPYSNVVNLASSNATTPLPAQDTLHFTGKKNRKKSEVPSIMKKPNTWLQKIKTWLQNLTKNLTKWFNPVYLFNQLFSSFQKREAKKVLSQLQSLTTEEARKIMNEPPLDKISFATPVRLSTGISKASTYFRPEHELMQHHKDYTYLSILEDYGIEWSRFKVARDALQNFYDGQGQTLDGVSIDVKESGSGKHKVKIKASATYDVDKLLALGGTGKKGESAAAGGFGEGAKMMALIMLRDYQVNQVTFRSREWQADFKLEYPGKQHVPNGRTRGLMVKLTPLNPPIEGNELEFETGDESLAETLKDGNQLFYNPKNPIFSNPTYENSTGGFKLLNEPEAPGYIYEAGQLRAFQWEGNYNALPGLIVWSNKKLLDLKDRDRVAIQDDDVKTILEKIVDGMSMEETAQGIRTLRKHWFYQNPDDLISDGTVRGDDKKAAEMLLEVFCKHYAWLAKAKDEDLKKNKPAFLPKGLVAIAPSDLAYGEDEKAQLEKLLQDGYIPVKPALKHIGVPNGASLLASRNALLEDKAKPASNLTPRQHRQVASVGSTLKSLAGWYQTSKDDSSYFRKEQQELSQLSELPVQVVSLPEKDQDNGFMKVSQDGKRILLDKALLDKNTYPQILESVLSMVEEHMRSQNFYFFQDDKLRWITGSLSELQQIKTSWDRTD